MVLSGLFFAQEISRFFGVASAMDSATSVRTYRVTGQIFFATAEAFHNAFALWEELKAVVIDVHAAHFWGITGINALGRVVLKFRHHSVAVEIVGMNEASQTVVDKLALHHNPSVDRRVAHARGH